MGVSGREKRIEGERRRVGAENRDYEGGKE